MLRPAVEGPDFGPVIDDRLSDVAAIMTQSMREATMETKQGWRDQVIAAGLGSRLANTIRSEVYPKSRNALNPAGWIYTKAPKIIDAFSRGATIRPINGAKYLWIPTKNVPRRMYRGARRMSPEEVELHFNAEFIIRPGKGGSLEAFLPVVRALSIKRPGFRRSTKRRSAQGREADLVLMFILRRTVRLPKSLDLQELANAGGVSFTRGASARLGR
jgi:hypothetical protein